MRTTRRESCVRAAPVIAPIAVCLIAACAPRIDLERQAEGAFDAPIDIEAFTGEWRRYADEVDAVPRQEGCRPELLPAAASMPRRGAVVMFHGFGGCPQQFYELGDRVAAEGFDVLLPLLPGHGVVQTDGQDDLSRLPTAKDWEARYAGLARRMNGLMARSPGTKVIVGFSLGGAMSLNADLQAAGLYDRQLLISPMLAIRGGPVVEGLTGFLGRVPGIRNIVVKPTGRREECRAWQSAGRAGFCDYRLKHVVALLNLQDLNAAMYEQWHLVTPIQIVAAGNEEYVSNGEILSFTERHTATGPISLCFMPDDVPHEMLSVYENADRDMYWLDDLLDDAVRFIADNQFFPTKSETDSETADQPRCRISPPRGVAVSALPAPRETSRTAAAGNRRASGR